MLLVRHESRASWSVNRQTCFLTLLWSVLLVRVRVCVCVRNFLPVRTFSKMVPISTWRRASCQIAGKAKRPLCDSYSLKRKWSYPLWYRYRFEVLGQLPVARFSGKEHRVCLGNAIPESSLSCFWWLWRFFLQWICRVVADVKLVKTDV